MCRIHSNCSYLEDALNHEERPKGNMNWCMCDDTMCPVSFREVDALLQRDEFTCEVFLKCSSARMLSDCSGM